jgi:hypothetical protein
VGTHTRTPLGTEPRAGLTHTACISSAPPPFFPPFLPLHVAGMPAIKDGQRCAHPVRSKQFRDVKEGGDHATVNDWAGKGKRFPTRPNSGHPTLNLREQAHHGRPLMRSRRHYQAPAFTRSRCDCISLAATRRIPPKRKRRGSFPSVVCATWMDSASPAGKQVKKRRARGCSNTRGC